jgi:hypothetical protein
MYYVIINMCFQPVNPFLLFGITCLLVVEIILVTVNVTCVTRLSLFVLHHNYMSMCSSGRNLCSSCRNMDLWRWIMGGEGSHQLPSLQKLLLEGAEKNCLICFVNK